MQKKLQKLALFALSTLGVISLAGCEDPNANGPKSGYYTYNTYLETKPTTWNVHDWETSDESYIPSFTEMGLYDVILKKTPTADGKITYGYEFVTEMARSFPKNITAEDLSFEQIEEIKARYGYKGSISKGLIWDIELNEAAVWQDGRPITADTYVQSLERQLSPELVNFRADSFYSSSLVVANAERYYKQGRYTKEPLFNYINTDTGEFTTTAINKGNYYLSLGATCEYASTIFSQSEEEISFYDLLSNVVSQGLFPRIKEQCQNVMDAYSYYLLKYIDHTNEELHNDWAEAIENNKYSSVEEEMMLPDNDQYFVNIMKFTENPVYVRKDAGNSNITEDNMKLYTHTDLINDLTDIVCTISNYSQAKRSWAYLMPLYGDYYNDDKLEFSEVGIEKIDDYKFRLYLSSPISLLNLRFALSSNWIVDVELYDKLMVNASGFVGTKYATSSVENYTSYGPYKLSTYEQGASFRIVKNEKWYGYSDGKHKGQFQMDEIFTKIYEKHETVRLDFEAGNLDDFAMNKEDMRDYGQSSRKTTTEESYTQKLSFNSDRSKLLGRTDTTTKQNKTILANHNFRKGLSLAVDRNAYAADATAGSKAFTGLLNTLYLTDVETGEMYRNTDAGKSVYQQVYGELGGDPYAENYTPSALEESVNGYNLAQATYYVQKAIEEELASTEEGHLQNGDTISLELLVYDDQSSGTQLSRTFLTNAFTKVVTNAVAKINEGKAAADQIDIKFEFTIQKDEDYYNTAKTGRYDLIFSIWGGAAINPYGLMEVYCDPEFESTCEYGFRGKQDSVMLEIDVNGDNSIDKATEVKSFAAWYTEITGTLIEPDIEGIREKIEKEGYTPTIEEEADIEEYNRIHDRKITILAGLEAGILNRFEAVPIVAKGTSSLNSFKIENGSPTYVNLVGYGGVRFLTFTYDDAQWADFVSKAGKNYANLYKA